jgi:hypothetical protein
MIQVRRTVLDWPNLFSFSKGFSNGSSSRSLTARDPLAQGYLIVGEFDNDPGHFVELS